MHNKKNYVSYWKNHTKIKGTQKKNKKVCTKMKLKAVFAPCYLKLKRNITLVN